MATYPVHLVTFGTHHAGDTVASADPNTIQDEIVAVEATMGVNPHISTTPSAGGSFIATSTTFATLAARLANIETGIIADSHSQYVHKVGGDTITPAPGVVGLSIQSPTSGSANVFQVTDSGGTPKVYVDSSLVLHSVNNSGTPADATGSSNTQGSSPYLATVDHVHRGGIAVVTSSTRPGSPYAGQLIWETDTNLLRAWNGTEWYCKNPSGAASRQVQGGTVSTTSATFVNSLSPFIFPKNNTNSTLRITMAADAYVTTASVTVTWGVHIGSTDYTIATQFYNTTSQHQTAVSSLPITGLAAGSISIQPRWKVSSGTAFQDQNSPLTLIVDEF